MIIEDHTSGILVEALRNNDIEKVSSLPKVDRHCHSIFSASFKSINNWSKRSIKNPPVCMKSLNEMIEYTQRELYPIIYNKVGFEFTAERTIIESIQDGITILEMSLDVNFIQFYDSGIIGFLDYIQNLVSYYKNRLQFRPEIGISRDREPSSQIKLSEKCIESGIFKSIDLYGNEYAVEPEKFKSLYNNAKNNGLKLKAHVGEFGDSKYIEKTLNELNLDEIQHGIKVIESESLMNRIHKQGIRLNVCPSSNVALSVTNNLANHPIKILFNSGIKLSINTDDKTIFGKTVSEEYMGLYQAGTLSAQELDIIRQDSLLD